LTTCAANAFTSAFVDFFSTTFPNSISCNPQEVAMIVNATSSKSTGFLSSARTPTVQARRAAVTANFR